MILKFIKSIREFLFPKEVTVEETPTAYDPSIYVDDACQILNVDLPKFIIVSTIFESDEHVMVVTDDGMKNIPADACNFKGAYMPDNSDDIYLATKIPCWNMKNLNSLPDFVDLRPYELAFPMLHETRHAWQKKFHYRKYYKRNAVGMEVINDMAEIDADGFALAYLLSEKTIFSIRDFPNESIQIARQTALDQGKRWARAEEILKEFNFGNMEKLKEAMQICKEIYAENG